MFTNNKFIEELIIGIERLVKERPDLVKEVQGKVITDDMMGELSVSREAILQLPLSLALPLYEMAVEANFAVKRPYFVSQHFNVLHYGTLPLSFLQRVYKIFIYRDKASLLQNIKADLIVKQDLQRDVQHLGFENVKPHILEYLSKETKNSGAFIVYRDGAVKDAADFNLDLMCGPKSSRPLIDFITGISQMNSHEINRSVTSAENMSYSLKTDTIYILKPYTTEESFVRTMW